MLWGCMGSLRPGLIMSRRAIAPTESRLLPVLLCQVGPESYYPHEMYMYVSGGYINQLDSRAWFESGPFISHFGYFW